MATKKTTKHFDQDKIVAMWAAGKTFKQIAEALGCSPVFAHRVTFGLKGKRTDEQKARYAKFTADRKAAAKERDSAGK